MQKKLYFTIGISGSGKSTYLRRNFRPEVIVNPDSIRKELSGNISDQNNESYIWTKLVPERLHNTLEKYGEAVLDATNVKSRERTLTLRLFGPDVETTAIVFYVDPRITKNRIKQDLDNKVDRSIVPDELVDKQYKSFISGIKNLSTQFDSVITIEQDSSGKTHLKEAYKAGDKVWIINKETHSPYDVGTILRYNQKAEEYEVRADNKGNIFLLYSKDLKPYTNENASSPIIRRNFMKISELNTIIREEIRMVLKEITNH